MIKKSNGTVTFIFDGAPKKSASLCGDFNNWSTHSTKLTKMGAHWTAQLKLKPGTYQFKYYVDGVWYNDKQADGYAANPFGGDNSVIKIG